MKTRMPKIMLMLIMFGVVLPCFAESEEKQEKRVVTPIALVRPDKEVTVYGLRADLVLIPFHYLDREKHLKTDVYGLSIGLIDMGDNSVTGIQLATLCGIVNNLQGIQCSGLFSFSVDAKGIQSAILLNGTTGTSGVQIAGFNRAEKLNGVQMAIANIAFSMSGVQFGGANLAFFDNDGVQFGMVNYAKGIH